MQILAAPTQVVIKGLTGDGKYVLYVDTTAQTLNVVPITGGKTVTVGPYTIDGAFATNTSGAVYFSAADRNTLLGPMWTWTPATGPTQISTSASLGGGYDLSPDGSLVAYFASTKTDSNTGTLVVSTADGKTQTPLVSNVDLANCLDDVQFVQPNPSVPPVILAAYCFTSDGGIPLPGGPAPIETVATFTGAGFTQKVVGTFDSMKISNVIQIDPKGTQMLLPGAPGIALYPIAGGAPTIVDPNGVAGSEIFATNGDIVYSKAAGGVSRYLATSAMTAPLLATGSYTAQSLSPDGKWMQLSQNMDQLSGRSDVFIASATTAGSATNEWMMTTAYTAGFTTDSRFEVFSTTTGTMTSDLYASPVSGGAATKVATVWGAAALPGSVIAISDNYTAAGFADIDLIDLANPTAKKTLVTQADPNVKLTPTNQLVYSWYCQPSSMAGIWVASPQ
jgi:hypothetical protein